MVGTYTEGDEPVPGFRLVNLLGWGRFGEVWKTAGPGGIQVALKIIPLSNNQGLREFRAMRLVKEIRHPNLVPILAFWLKDRHGSFIDDVLADDSQSLQDMASEMLIAMGLGERSVYDRFKECHEQELPGIPRDELLSYFEDAAKAIDYLNQNLHTMGLTSASIQHCDIKPHNLLLVGGMVQVCDLGVARILEDIRASAATGSAAYIAPEFLKHNKPSKNTDQYSLALSYIELRTGSLPFNVKSAAAAYLAHLEGKLDLSLLPEGERQVLAQATALDPDARFPSCLSMVRALHDVGLKGSKSALVRQAIKNPERKMPSANDNRGFKREKNDELSQTSPRIVAKPLLVPAQAQVPPPPPRARPPLPPPPPAPLPRRPAPTGQLPHQIAAAKLEMKLAWQQIRSAGSVRQHITRLYRQAQFNVQRWAEVAESRRKALRILQVVLVALGGMLIASPAALYQAAEPEAKKAELKPAVAKKSVTAPVEVKLPEAAAKLFRESKDLMTNGVYNRAIETFTQLLAKHPDFGPAYVERAAASVQTGALDDALKDVNRARELNQSDARYDHVRAQLFLELSKYPEAIAAATEALKKSPKSAEAYLTRSAAYTASKQLGRAILDYSKAKDLQPTGKSTERVSRLVYSAKGAWVAAATTTDHLEGLRIWKGTLGEDEFSLPGRVTVAFSQDERLLATVGRAGGVLIYDLQTRQPIVELQGHWGPVTCLAFDSQGRVLSGSTDQTLRLWELPSGRQLEMYRAHTGPITSLAIAPDGRTFASAADDGSLFLWEPGQAEPRRTFSGQSGATRCLQFSPDGRCLASGGADRIVHLWDLQAAHEERTLLGLPARPSSLAFSPDGQLLAAATGDSDWPLNPGQAKVWDVHTGQARATYGGGSTGLFSLAFSPDGKYLVAAGLSWQLRRWEITDLQASPIKPINETVAQSPLDRKPGVQ